MLRKEPNYTTKMVTRKRRADAFRLYMFLLYIFITQSKYSTATDTLFRNQQISVGQTLISAGQKFEVGFFSPGNSSKQYVGIWYKNISKRKYVWVANRESPVTLLDSASSLTIGNDGNLKLLDGNQNSVWSTNISVQSNSTIAVISDNGNFILKDSASGLIFWESFDYPCDTLLPNMMLGMINRTGEKRLLSSWQTGDNPAPGKFLLGLSPELPPQAFTWNGLKPYWRGGPWDGKFIGIPDQDEGYSNGMNILPDTQQGTAYLTFNTLNISYDSVIIITPTGSLRRVGWDKGTEKWIVTWEAPDPQNPCDVYGACGPFGVCNKNSNSPICECLKGFTPKSNDEWSKRNWTGGCVRRTELFCEKNASNIGLGRTKNDGFQKLSGVKLPDHIEYLVDDNAFSCKQWCLKNCSCSAYAFVAGLGCMVWAADLIDIQYFSFSGEDLFLRLAYSELGNSEEMKRANLVISFTTISGILFLGAFMYGLHRWKTYQREKSRGGNSGWRSRIKQFYLDDTSSKDTQEDTLQQESSELTTFDFAKIVGATNNFSNSNKLGEGGFGPVYKGMLEDGQEIAVKRLSSHSGQGIEEFKNEIILISKLQHRNLVRLLGCCIEGGEKLIIYEYMTNKSLDTFLFDPKKQVHLDWAKRFNIIQGISRGLLYLHRDSCLRVIHRDLKGSNILLDDQMNPKISDFGLARIFQVTQELANTSRIAGTFGYMSPEYAMGGIFSEKSDVYSFGVMLLEIVSSKRNTGFFYHEQHINLLGYAWKLWNEGRGLELMDQESGESCNPSQVMRCIHVGLLCVQDHAAERPTMSAIVLMLSSETDLPLPKQPTFTFESLLDSGHGSQCNQICSINEVTVSMTVGR